MNIGNNQCITCKQFKHLSEFYKDKSAIFGYGRRCKVCESERDKKRRANNPDKHKLRHKKWREKNAVLIKKKQAIEYIVKSLRTPKWLSESQIEEIANKYVEAKKLTIETGVKYSVDHIIPLKGKHVSGLHVPWNLRVISLAENVSKWNKS